MSNLAIFSNNASSLLASAITDVATQCTVTAGQGTLFPSPGADEYAPATLEDVSGDLEIVWITGRIGDTLTIVRGQEGTTPIAFASGSRVECRMTAGLASSFLQKGGGDTLSGTTTNNGVIQQNTNGSIQGGEFTGVVRGAAGQTANQIQVPVGSGAPTIGSGAGASPILTAANLLNNLPANAGLMQTGMICLWSGASNAVPAGFAICDGTNGTPDLRDQFVLGAGGVLPGTGGSANTVTAATDPSGSLAIAGTSLTVNQMPSHTHEVYVGSIFGYFVNSTQTWRGLNLDSGSYQTNFPAGGPAGASGTQILQSTGNGDPHTHGLSGSLSHTHAYSLPPYKALFYIMKT